jgi:ABC-type lipoprotein release transport system permease subunit
MMATLSRSKGQEFLSHSQNGMMFEAVGDRVASLEIAAFVGTAAILLTVAAGAAVAPALRILRMDPARTLRDE